MLTVTVRRLMTAVVMRRNDEYGDDNNNEDGDKVDDGNYELSLVI